MIKRIILLKGEEERVKRGHPWVYDNEVAAVLEGFGNNARPAELEAGETADVESSRKEYLGRAFVNPASKIIARIYSPSKEGVDGGFFKRRFREAMARRAWGSGGVYDSQRLVFAESDFLPGLIVDCYAGWKLSEWPAAAGGTACGGGAADGGAAGVPGRPPGLYMVMQFLTAAMDMRRDMALEALLAVLPEPPVCVVEKSLSEARRLEGLPPREGVLEGDAGNGRIVILENNIPFIIDLLGGQKTGCFLDQRENHALAAGIAQRMFLLSALNGADSLL